MLNALVAEMNMVKIMKTVFEWIMSKDAVKVEFDTYLNFDMDRILEINMAIYSGSMTLSKYGVDYMQHPITLKRPVLNTMFRADDGSFKEDKIIEVLDEMYEECFDILDRIKS